MRSNEPIGIVAELMLKRASIQRGRNTVRTISAHVDVEPTPVLPSVPELNRLIYATCQPRGNAAHIMRLVAEQADLHVDALRGHRHDRRVVNARSVVAVLAEEFAPKLSARAIDDALMRGNGTTAWYRERHQDRCTLYPSYAALHERCRAIMLERRK